jgi:hypothetical protein
MKTVVMGMVRLDDPGLGIGHHSPALTVQVGFVDVGRNRVGDGCKGIPHVLIALLIHPVGLSRIEKAGSEVPTL